MFLCKLRVSNYGIKRGTDIVGHVEEKKALSLIGVLSCGQGLHKLLLVIYPLLFRLRDVTDADVDLRPFIIFHGVDELTLVVPSLSFHQNVIFNNYIVSCITEMFQEGIKVSNLQESFPILLHHYSIGIGKDAAVIFPTSFPLGEGFI